MKSTSKATAEKPTLTLRRKSAWTAWLDKNQGESSGVWLRLAKKASGLKSLSYDAALDVALCYGWIDGQAKSDGDEYWLQKFTPRGRRSIWSKRNREKAVALIDGGQMTPAGLAEVERAQKDGRWDAAYDSPSRITVPDDLQAALNKNARARTFFETLDSRNRSRSCSGFTRPRRLRREQSASSSSSRCWRATRGCTLDHRTPHAKTRSREDTHAG